MFQGLAAERTEQRCSRLARRRNTVAVGGPKRGPAEGIIRFMAFVNLKAWRARSAAQAALSARLKTDLAAALGLGAADSLAVNEIACADPGCPDMETIVLVMRAGEPTRALRIPRPMEAVGIAQIAALVEEDHAGRTPHSP